MAKGWSNNRWLTGAAVWLAVFSSASVVLSNQVGPIIPDAYCLVDSNGRICPDYATGCPGGHLAPPDSTYCSTPESDGVCQSGYVGMECRMLFNLTCGAQMSCVLQQPNGMGCGNVNACGS